MRGFTILFVFVLQCVFAAAQSKIIDMHIHSYGEKSFDQQKLPQDYYGVKGAANAVVHRTQAMALFKKLNIVKAVVSGDPESGEEWEAHDSSKRGIKGLLMHAYDD